MELQITSIKDFPSKQAEEVQKHLLELDEQGKLLEYFKEQYQDLGKYNSLARYIKDNWEKDGKKLYIEWTGVEVYKENKTLIKATCVKLSEVTKGSGRYFLWKCCTCGYEWVAIPNKRTSENFKRGCPSCGGTSFVKNKNDLETFCKEHSEFNKLLTEFMGEDEKHNKILPSEISRSSAKLVWWHCSKCGHEWKASTHTRVCAKSGCPACGGHILILGVNDLETFCKEHSEFNKLLTEFMGKDIAGNKILPSEICRASNKEVWWKCSNPACGHEWHSMVSTRTYKNSGCPACAGNILIQGVNDLDTYCQKQHPELKYILEQFVGLDENNNHIIPSEIARGSTKKVLFKCNTCGKEWLASIVNRTANKTGCPHCAEYMLTSFPEQFIFNSLLQLFPNTKNRQKDIIKHYEYDIVIPELKLCIEYSGYNWHQDKLDRDQAKADNCRDNKVNFLQIYAHQVEITDEQGLEVEDSYEKNQILYKVERDKSQHIKQLQYIIKFILQEYAPNHSIEEINFELAEQQANEVMGKA